MLKKKVLITNIVSKCVLIYYYPTGSFDIANEMLLYGKCVR